MFRLFFVRCSFSGEIDFLCLRKCVNWTCYYEMTENSEIFLLFLFVLYVETKNFFCNGNIQFVILTFWFMSVISEMCCGYSRNSGKISAEDSWIKIYLNCAHLLLAIKWRSLKFLTAKKSIFDCFKFQILSLHPKIMSLLVKVGKFMTSIRWRVSL